MDPTVRWNLLTTTGEGTRSRKPEVKRWTRRTDIKIPVVQLLYVMSNVTSKPPGWMQPFSLNVGDGHYKGLFDGTRRLLNWDIILWLAPGDLPALGAIAK